MSSLSDQRLSLIVPAYNERGTIRTILARAMAAEIPLPERELLVVDDGSDDGSAKLLDDLAGDPTGALSAELRRQGVADPDAVLANTTIRVFHHPENRGKSAAIRTAIPHATGAITLIQDADLEYDPAEYPKLLEPILQGRADVVYGTRFHGPSRRVLYYWHSVGNRMLTSFSNILTNLNISDLHTGYKCFRTEVLQSLHLDAEGFGFEVEVTAKIARLNLRLFEVPVTYSGRSYVDGKKVRWWDGLRAVKQIARYGLAPGRALRADLTQEEALEDLAAVTTLTDHMYRALRPMLGEKILEVGAGVGNMTAFLLRHGEVTATDIDEPSLERLRQRFGDRGNLHVHRWDLAEPYPDSEARFDTVVCINVLEHIEDEDRALREMLRLLKPGGRLALLVPQGMWLYGPFDKKIGHYRRYSPEGLQRAIEGAGFTVRRVVHFNLLGVPGWWLNAKVLKRDHLSAGMLRIFDRISPPILWAERHAPLPYGLSLIAEAQRPEAAPQEVLASEGRMR